MPLGRAVILCKLIRIRVDGLDLSLTKSDDLTWGENGTLRAGSIPGRSSPQFGLWQSLPETRRKMAQLRAYCAGKRYTLPPTFVGH
jgi:hypothetical protein